MKRYAAGSDTRGAEISCNYYQSSNNYNYNWTLYYLFRDGHAHAGCAGDRHGSARSAAGYIRPSRTAA